MKVFYKRSAAFGLVAVIVCSFLSLFSAKNSTEPRYSAYGDAVTYALVETETINYTRREENYFETVKGAPQYYQISKYPNSCGPVAGAMIVGFYDKYYLDLIPDYSSTVSSGTYKKADSVYIPNLIGQLYTLMGTNENGAGVSETDCLNGLRTYVQNKGRALTYINIYGDEGINVNSYQIAVDNNRPSLIFCNKMSVYNFYPGATSEELRILTYEGGHVVVAYGYYEVNYYSASSLIRTDKYLAVQTGLSGVTGYLKLDNMEWCNAAYAVAVD
ncbi:MAG: hypothetical protein K2N84_04290 [Clostridia bacterium]|nr:hypothetical protein [Clostridia bacterium]